MRVTERIVFRHAVSDVMNLRSRLFTLQQQGATGKRFQSIEEDPTSAERIRMLREAREATLHYETNIIRSKTQLEAADAALDEATNLLIRAKELAIAGSNETMTAEQRAIYGQEVDSLFESMVGVANTEAAGEFVFGGFLVNQEPFQTDGTFLGDNGQKEVDVGPSSRVQVNVSGDDTFTVSGGIDVFTALSDLQTALNTNDLNGIRTAIDQMDLAQTQISNGRTDAGLKLNRLDVASAVRTRLEDSLTSEESDILDVDSVEVFMDLNATLSALQSAVSVSQRVVNTPIIGT